MCKAWYEKLCSIYNAKPVPIIETIIVIDMCIFRRVLSIFITVFLIFENCWHTRGIVEYKTWRNADVEGIIGILCFNTLWQDCTISEWIKQLCQSQTTKTEPKWNG